MSDDNPSLSVLRCPHCAKPVAADTGAIRREARREAAREALERFRCIVSDDEWWEEAHLEYGVRESLRAEVDELVRRFGLEDGDD